MRDLREIADEIAIMSNRLHILKEYLKCDHGLTNLALCAGDIIMELNDIFLEIEEKIESKRQDTENENKIDYEQENQ
jgi:hypothetical protein